MIIKAAITGLRVGRRKLLLSSERLTEVISKRLAQNNQVWRNGEAENVSVPYGSLTGLLRGRVMHAPRIELVEFQPDQAVEDQCLVVEIEGLWFREIRRQASELSPAEIIRLRLSGLSCAVRAGDYVFKMNGDKEKQIMAMRRLPQVKVESE